MSRAVAAGVCMAACILASEWVALDDISGAAAGSEW
eukprot:CAMPEP_0115842422 /NCGR_PEP_ID=MMETSP0287-20121206/7793_1 /TAXON_ID=412157 /ORGANISM="Chrysochromulina rotalis, Strain UIO044" /LENGTH=35 /DNA_ID= /DNA_START= /DNA_END= /DNA_ORIENTATION=